jgi:hypothetical protein
MERSIWHNTYALLLKAIMNTNATDNNQRNENAGQGNDNVRSGEQTPMSKAISESDNDMDALRKKTDAVKHVDQSEDEPGTPWSPGQETSGQ